jgi:hypothetical protein
VTPPSVIDPMRALRESYAEAAALQLKARTSILHQIEAFEPGWMTGGVHREICQHLEGIFTLVERGAADPANCAGGPRLILQTPPGIGKTLMSGVHMLAHGLGRHPDWQFIYATYNHDKACEVGRDTRSRMQDPRYPELFPGTVLDKGAQSMDYFLTTRGGKATFTGVGGTSLGRRAHCVAAGECVQTRTGPRPIEDIREGDYVWSWNHSQEKRELKRVRATMRTPQQPVRRLRLGSGATLTLTDGHLLFDGVCYRKVSTFTAGDALYADHTLPPVCETHPNPACGPAPKVLRPGVLRGIASQAVPPLRDVRRPSEQETRPYDILLHCMPLGTGPQSSPLPDLPVVRGPVLRGPLQEPVLREEVLSGRAQRPDARRGEPELGRRGRGTEALSVFPASTISEDDAPRWREMRLVPGAGETRRPPHRRRPPQRRREQCRDALCVLPHAVPRLEPVALEGWDEGGDADVYDLDIEGNHNFFVGEILVHNCMIVDDPFGSEVEGRGELHQLNVLNWILSTARSRLHPFGALVVIHQRWHVKDAIGRLLELSAQNKSGDQWCNCRYPMVAEVDELWRKKGDSVHVERFSNAWCEKTRNSVSEWVWNAMYQQKPTVDSGTRFKREWFKLIPREKFPKNLNWYISTDFAATAGGGDHSVARPFAIDEYDNLYYDDPYHAQVDPHVAHNATFDLYQRNGAKGIFVEKGVLWNTAKGEYRQQQERRRVYPRIIEFNRISSKGEHSSALASHMAAGKVFHIDSQFTRNVVIPQYMAFTGERGVREEDDIVDADYLPLLSWLEIRRPSPLLELPTLDTTPAINQQIISGYGTPKKKSSPLPWTAGEEEGETDEDDLDLLP